MEDGGARKRRFKVHDEISGKKCMIQYYEYSTFVQKCKQKFRYAQDSDVIFVLEDEPEVEMDESAFECSDNDEKLRMKPLADSASAFLVNSTGTLSLVNNGKDDKEEKWNIENASDFVEEARDVVQHNDTKDQASWTWCSPKVEELTSGAAYIKQMIAERGPDDLIKILQEADNLPRPLLSICVTGSSGQGKSKLINTLRNLSPGDKHYAEVGTTETTMARYPYAHPDHPNIVFWDVPGLGTLNFPRADYLSEIHFEEYNFFLICSSSRFTEDDAWLATQVKKQEKQFYFIRTKVDQDVDNAKMELQESFDKNVEMEKIRKNCQTNIGPDIPVFLISSHLRTEYDFPKLIDQIIHDAPAKFYRSIIFGFLSVSKTSLENKAELLKNEIWKQALIMALTPVDDMMFLINAINKYRKHFLLAPKDIELYADMLHVTVSDFERNVLMIRFDNIILRAFCVVETVRLRKSFHFTAISLPFIGIPIFAGLQVYLYRKVGNFLEEIIDEMKNNAIHAHTYIAETLTI